MRPFRPPVYIWRSRGSQDESRHKGKKNTEETELDNIFLLFEHTDMENYSILKPLMVE